jgi:hypothetical protein
VTKRPGNDEFAPFYTGYMSLVPEEDVLPILSAQSSELEDIERAVSLKKESFRYAPDKWGIREVFGHMGDAEWVLGYRTLCISRLDQTLLPGFDEQHYVAHGGFGQRTLEGLLSELTDLREGNLGLLRGLDDPQWRHVGNANGSDVSVRAIAFIIAGHLRHYIGMIQGVTKSLSDGKRGSRLIRPARGARSWHRWPARKA